MTQAPRSSQESSIHSFVSRLCQPSWRRTAAAFAFAGSVAGCGGGSNGTDPAAQAVPSDPVGQGPQITLSAPKTVEGTNRISLQWSAHGNALVFAVLLKPSEAEQFAIVADGLSGTSTVINRGPAWKLDFPTARVKVRACTPGVRCVDSNEQPLLDALMAGIVPLQSARPDPSFTNPPSGPVMFALIGTSMMFNANGNRLLATGDAIYEFNRDAAGLWSRTPVQAKGGAQVLLSDDGNTMVLTAPGEPGTFGGVNPQPGPDDGTFDNSPFFGAVYVYVRDAQGQWQQQAHIRADSRLFGEDFGASAALSGNGNVLSVASAFGSARMYMFSRDAAGVWHQDAIFAFPQEQPSTDRESFEGTVGLSHDGRVVAIQGTDQFEQDNLLVVDRFVEVYANTPPAGWVKQARLPSRRQFILDVDDFFGNSIALDEDGTTIAVGAPEDDSDDTDTVGDPTNHKARMSGAVYIFKRAAGTSIWTQQAFLKARQAAPRDNFGRRIVLSRDGSVLIGQALGFAANVPGINRNNEADRVSGTPPGIDGSGSAAYIFERCGCAMWHQRATAIPPTPVTPLQTNVNIAMSGDAKTYAIAANSLQFVGGVTTQRMRVYVY